MVSVVRLYSEFAIDLPIAFCRGVIPCPVALSVQDVVLYG